MYVICTVYENYGLYIHNCVVCIMRRMNNIGSYCAVIVFDGDSKSGNVPKISLIKIGLKIWFLQPYINLRYMAHEQK